MIGGLAIVIGGVGMMNAQLMAVYERTREIGVLRATGWRRSRVLRLILGESIVVCLAGGLLGILLGWLLLRAALSGDGDDGHRTGRLSPGLVAQALLVVLVLGLVGGLYPAWRASRLLPVEALRYEGGSERQGAPPAGGRDGSAESVAALHPQPAHPGRHCPDGWARSWRWTAVVKGFAGLLYRHGERHQCRDHDPPGRYCRYQPERHRRARD